MIKLDMCHIDASENSGQIKLRDDKIGYNIEYCEDYIKFEASDIFDGKQVFYKHFQCEDLRLTNEVAIQHIDNTGEIAWKTTNRGYRLYFCKSHILITVSNTSKIKCIFSKQLNAEGKEI